jgi:DNA-binding response OmpR family regulator
MTMPLVTDSACHSGFTILLVDDDDEVRDVLADVLRSEGYHAVCARSAEEAEAHARRQPLSLVLLDYRLGEDSAEFVASRLRAELGSALPIVLLSGATDLHLRGAEVGVTATLAKPFGVDDLLRCVDAHCLTQH